MNNITYKMREISWNSAAVPEIVRIKNSLNVLSYILFVALIIPLWFFVAALENGYDLGSPELMVPAVALVAMIVVIVLCGALLARLDYVAGSYRCKCCGHSYVPSLQDLKNGIPAFQYTWLECPECKEHSWHEKELYKVCEEEEKA